MSDVTNPNPDDTRAEVFHGKDGWRFRLISKGNGEIVSQSEGYENRHDAIDTAVGIVGAEDVEVVEE